MREDCVSDVSSRMVIVSPHRGGIVAGAPFVRMYVPVATCSSSVLGGYSSRPPLSSHLYFACRRQVVFRSSHEVFFVSF